MAKNSRTAKLNSRIRQWKHNRDLLSVIPSKTYPDWIVTVTFYTALHAVESVFANDGASAQSHDQRNEILAKTNRYKHIFKSYHPLFILGRTVRYLAKPERWVTPGDLDPHVLKEMLYPIEKSVQKLIGRDLELAAIALNMSDPAAPPEHPTE